MDSEPPSRVNVVKPVETVSVEFVKWLGAAVGAGFVALAGYIMFLHKKNDKVSKEKSLAEERYRLKEEECHERDVALLREVLGHMAKNTAATEAIVDVVKDSQQSQTNKRRL